MNAGTTFVAINEHGNQQGHLRVILSDTHQFPEAVLVVVFSTYKPGKDPACIVRPEEHPSWLTRETCVLYRYLQVTTVAELLTAAGAGQLKVLDSVSDQLLDKIYKGAGDSQETNPELVDLLIEQGIIRLDE